MSHGERPKQLINWLITGEEIAAETLVTKGAVWNHGWRDEISPAATMTPDKYVKMDGWGSHIPARCCRRARRPLFYRNWKDLSVSSDGWTHKRYGPKRLLSGCLARFFPDIPTRHLHRWRFICCLFPLDSFSFSIPIFPTPPSSQELVCQRKPCTSPHAYQTVYPFFSPCGRRPPSVAVTANRHAEGPFQAVI